MVDYLMAFIFGLYLGIILGAKIKEKEAKKYRRLYFNRWRATR
jgi:uncharacterized protein YebE (UPF0316 family)